MKWSWDHKIGFDDAYAWMLDVQCRAGSDKITEELIEARNRLVLSMQKRYPKFSKLIMEEPTEKSNDSFVQKMLDWLFK